MDNDKLKEYLKQSLDEMNKMRRLEYGNSSFTNWKNGVGAVIGKELGEESREYRRFMNAAGKGFIIRTPTGLAQEYQRQLDCYEEVLQTLITGKENY